MTDALERARADLAAGRAWQARDRLTSHLVHRQDDDVLELLARVHLAMGDQPKAGALLHVVRRGDVVDDVERSAVDAWRRRFGDADARWRSIPAPVRRARRAELDELRGAVRTTGADSDLPPAEAVGVGGKRSSLLGCLAMTAVLVMLVVLMLVGAATVVGWLL